MNETTTDQPPVSLAPPLTRLPITRIAVFRALKLGDFLVATPAFRALRAAFPQAQIDYVGLPWAQDVTARYADYFDNFVRFPGLPGLPETDWQAEEVVDFMKAMQLQTYDLVIQLHGNGTLINPFLELWNAKYIAGFGCDAAYWPNRDYFMEYPEDQPEVRRLLGLLEFCGLPVMGEELDFPLTAGDEQELAALPEYGRLGREYVVIHAGAISSKPWPAEHFAALADACAGQGLAVALTGTENEKAVTAEVQARMKHQAVDLAGRTSIGAAAALIRHARLFVGNDTGTSHIAVATGTPSIRIISSSDPARWAPLDAALHPAVLPADATPANVIARARQLLKQKTDQLMPH